MHGNTIVIQPTHSSTGLEIERRDVTGISPTAPDASSEELIPADECWLFKAPKFSAKQSIATWLREIFDSPTSVFWSSKRNLLTRLETILACGGPIAAYQFGGSTPSLNFTSSDPLRQSFPRLSPSATSSSATMTRRGTYFMHSVGSTDNLSTLTNGNMLHSASNGQPIFSLPPQLSRSHRLGSGNSISQLSQSSSGQLIHRRSGSFGKLGSCDALESLQTNVQEIARMQEDNLKADVAALVAAAAGKYGSQHSLGSQGMITSDGTNFRLSSAPESPSSSNPCLDQMMDTAHPTHDSMFNRASLEVLPKLSNPTGDLSFPINTNTNMTTNQYSSRSLRHKAFQVLPQKPFVPVDMASPQFMNPTSSMESRTHFGFRPLRKVSAPQYSSRPPALPVTSRRFSNLPNQATNQIE